MFKIKKLDEQNKKKCNITFIIGNGFDIGLKMKTRYEDMYQSYLGYNISDTNVISAFKGELSAREPYDKWSDFEMGMSEYAKTLSSEDELVECVRDFKGHMVSCLKKENEIMIDKIKDVAYRAELVKELDRSLDLFYKYLVPNDVNQIESLIEDTEVNRNYVTFNYTTTLEAFFDIKARYQKVFESEPIHIHGSLNGDVVLGIDNVEQIKGACFNLTRKGIRAFVKTLFNEQFDKLRLDSAKRVISESNVICVYGFSMGNSDKMWVDLLANWLLQNPKHHLVVYQYDESKYNLYNRDEMMDVEDDRKTQLLEKLGIDDEGILRQIHIPIGADIFNFKFLKIETPKPMGSLIHSF